MTVPLLGRLSQLQIVQERLSGYSVIRCEPNRYVVWVSWNPRVAAFLRDWFTGWDAGGLRY